MKAADTDVDQVEDMCRVNVFGLMQLAQIFHRMLIAARGVIVVDIGSIWTYLPLRRWIVV